MTDEGPADALDPCGAKGRRSLERFACAILLAAGSIASSGCVSLDDPNMFVGARGELVIPIGSEADGVGLGCTYFSLPLVRSDKWLLGWNASVRSIPRQGDNIFSLATGLELQRLHLAGTRVGFIGQLGLALNSANGDVELSPLLGAGLQTHVMAGPLLLLISASYMHAPFFDEASASYGEPSWLSLQITFVLHE